MNRHRPKTRRPSIDPGVIAVGAAMRGCSCHPTIEHRHTDGIRRVILGHESDCPAVDTGPQLLIQDRHR